MSHRCVRPLAVLSTILCLGITARAQEISVLRGEIHSETQLNFMEYRVELMDMRQRGESYRAELHPGGSFELRHVPLGEYTLRVSTQDGESVHEQFVIVNGQATLDVRLPLKPPSQRSVPGTVSLRELQHPPDRKAFQAFFAAQKAAASGSTEKAVEQLERAVRISPEFADAHTNLGVQLMRLRRFTEAEEETKLAIEIGGATPLRLCNLAYAQFYLRGTQEAIGSVRAALRLDAAYPQAHLLLGSILAASPATRAEAIPHLERAAETIPSARTLLEKIRRVSPN